MIALAGLREGRVGCPVIALAGLRAVVCLAALAATVGCGAATDLASAASPSATSTSTPAPTPNPTGEPTVTVQPADYRVGDVEAAMRSVAAELRDVPLTPRFANGSFVVCAGGEADTFVDTKVGYSVRARLDYLVGQVGSDADAEQAVSSLESAGWLPRNDDWATDGVHRGPGNDRWSLFLTRDGLQLRLDLYADAPVVLVNVSGPCAPTPAEEANRLRMQEAQRLRVPGSVPLSDAPAPTDDGHILPPRRP